VIFVVIRPALPKGSLSLRGVESVPKSLPAPLSHSGRLGSGGFLLVRNISSIIATVNTFDRFIDVYDIQLSTFIVLHTKSNRRVERYIVIREERLG
jgi:hypothetical protein